MTWLHSGCIPVFYALLSTLSGFDLQASRNSCISTVSGNFDLILTLIWTFFFYSFQSEFSSARSWQVCISQSNRNQISCWWPTMAHLLGVVLIYHTVWAYFCKSTRMVSHDLFSFLADTRWLFILCAFLLGIYSWFSIVHALSIWWSITCMLIHLNLFIQRLMP